MGSDLKRTPLYQEHVRLGGKMIPFAGFEMPVQYREGVRQEHLQVRQRAGLFDVSHMGEFLLRGDGAEAFVNCIVTNDVSRARPGQAQYTVMLKQDGGIIDDLLVYRFADRFRLVVNAANIEKDFAWVQARLKERGPGDVELTNESADIGLIALQGPESEMVMDPLSDLDAAGIGYYRFAEGRVAGEPCVLSRTGYTGEDGFEIYCAAEATPRVWNAILEAGGGRVKPVGLGARDSLRLEIGYALYGNDIDEGTTPLEAGLGWTVKLDKGDFVGREAVRAQKEEGVARKLCGFVMTGRAFPRHGYQIRRDGEPIGEVRSGTVGPSVGQGIGTGYVASEYATPGTGIDVVVRGREEPAEIVKLPFYKEGSIKR